MLQRRYLGLVMVAAGLTLALGGLGCGKDEGLTIKRIEPKTGHYSGRDVVTIHGSGFQGDGTKGVKVFFGNRPARVLGFDGANRLRVESPGAPGGKPGENVDITIVFDDGRRFTAKDVFRYIDPTPLTVDDFGTVPPRSRSGD
jgi:hypothetical protein